MIAQQAQPEILLSSIIELQLKIVLENRKELFKSFEMHQAREEFLKRLPQQDSQVKKGIGVAQFHKFATAKYADSSLALIQSLIAENKLLKKQLNENR